MNDFLAQFPWYVHVAMSFALLMAALYIGLLMRGQMSKRSNGNGGHTHQAALLAQLAAAERRLAVITEKLENVPNKADLAAALKEVRHDIRNAIQSLVNQRTP